MWWTASRLSCCFPCDKDALAGKSVPSTSTKAAGQLV
jgi:hypothetical protein